jgi:hypothetical protein
MVDILSKIPLYLLIPILIVVSVALAFLLIKAFREGRSFKLWGFEIGQRPDQVKKESKTTGALTRSASDTKAIPEDLESYQFKERYSHSQKRCFRFGCLFCRFN